MKRSLKAFLYTFLGLLLLIVAGGVIAVAVVFYRPEWIVSPKNVHWALAKINPEWKLNYSKLELAVTSQSLWKKHVNVSSEDLCFEMNDPHELKFCARSIEVRLLLDFSGFQIRILDRPVLRLAGGNLDLRLKPGAPVENDGLLPEIPEPTFRALFGPYVDRLPKTEWGDLNLELERFNVVLSPELQLQGKASINNAAVFERLDLNAGLQVIRGSTTTPLNFQINSSLDLKSEEWKATVLAPDLFASDVTLLMNESLTLSANAQIRGRTAKIELQTQWRIDQRRIQIASSADVILARPPFLKNRKIELPQIQLSQKGVVTYQLRPTAYDFQVETDLESPSFSGIELKSHAALDFSYRPNSDWRQELKPRAARLSLTVPDIRKLAQDIRWTRLQIPAPFYRMAGPLKLTVDTDVADFTKGSLKALLTTDFADGLQAAKLEVPADIFFQNILTDQRSIDVRAEILIHKLILEMPRLSILNLPRFNTDSRIQKPGVLETPLEKEKPAPPPFRWNLALKIRTPQDPIILRSNLVPEPIPIKLNQEILMGSHRPLLFTGLTSLSPMNVELFRRKIRVEKINVDRAANEVTALDGLFSYSTSEVTVRIRLLGTTESPQVVWESDPPLSQRQIISIVVFGKSLNELSQEESSSAQNLERAFADGALGIASLFLLASTPIESVSYDPISQSYAARLKVDGQTSLSLGSDFEDKQSLALRRQLGGAWSIKTELQSTTDQQDQLSTFLEWFKRF